MHAGKDAGHFGYKRTLAKLRQRYVWPYMMSDVKGVMELASTAGGKAKAAQDIFQATSYQKGGLVKL